MAEPRKPRVIRTRTPAKPPPGTAPAGTAPAGAVPEAATAQDSPVAPGAASGTVRGTSDKVAVLPVPAAGSGTESGEPPPKTPAPRTRTPQTPAPKKPVFARLRPGREAATSNAVPRAATETGKPETDKPETGKTRAGGTEAGISGKASSAGGAAARPPVPRVVRSAVVPGKASPGKTAAKKTAPGAAASGPSGNGSASGNGDGRDSGGAQVLAFPIPGYKRRRRTILLSAAGVVAVLALVMGIALFSPALAVRTVVFDGNKLVSENTLQLAVAPIVSRPLPQVTGEEVSSLLESVVQVKSARIEARPPSTLVVHVVERVPVALLKNGKGFSLVDQDGVELGTTKDPATAGLPLIDGGKAAIGKDTFQAMTAVLATLPKSILAQLANATAKSPDAVELALVDGRSVIWGNASDMELKAQVLEALLNAPAPTPQEGKPEPVPAQVFDVSAPRHPVTR